MVKPSADAEFVMRAMTFTIDPGAHAFVPCPWVAKEFCRICGLHQSEGKHVQAKRSMR